MRITELKNQYGFTFERRKNGLWYAIDRFGLRFPGEKTRAEAVRQASISVKLGNVMMRDLLS